jgi:putative ABC transport system permease protein
VELIDNIADKIDEIKETQQNLRYKQILIKHPTWYIYDRKDEKTYSDYIDDANSIANLSKIFPVVFFAVAVLVSLISMNRMVEEDRQEIGTLKSLGFSNATIMTKYFIFSLIATSVGGILGSAIGLTCLPTIIFEIYKILFDVPNLVLSLNLKSTLLGFFITVICVCGTTIITAYKVLREKPSELMRPKAPKGGKRVFLENIKFIWNNIKFSQKVTIRNLFRYKKRVLVTVCGIAGCTALMLCGFGIRDAITDIAEKQFNYIFKFDGTVYMSGINDNYEKIFDNESITSVSKTQRINTKVDDVDSYIFVSENSEELSNLINMEDVETGKIVNLETGKVIITEKLSKLAGLNVGDKISIIDVKNKTYEYEISGIVNNYIGHYIYMDKETFEQSGEEYTPNVVYINIDETANQEELATKLLENDEVLSVIFKDSLIKSVDDMLGSLNNVVYILIILAAALSFVVLHNLSNININERKREIATLKVLGFYDKEVDDYITKENILLTIIGIAIGLVCGYFLTKAVIGTVEIETCRFIYNIKPISYIYSAIISGIFTLIVNFMTHFKLKKINMIDSLKSIE